MNILVNNHKINLDFEDFPILISGAENTGTSFFSIGLISELVKSGYKAVFFSAYKAAKNEFKKQIIESAESTIIVESGEEKVFIKSIKGISDLNERIILIKNIDRYSYKLFNSIKGLNRIIYSGDIDRCQFSEDLMKLKFKTKIYFSQSKKFPNKKVKDLPKYKGRIISDKYNGLIAYEI